jgi:hypothetical protein
MDASSPASDANGGFPQLAKQKYFYYLVRIVDTLSSRMSSLLDCFEVAIAAPSVASLRLITGTYIDLLNYFSPFTFRT